MSDPFKDAVGGFIKADDLIGRGLLITPQTTGQRESTQKGAAPGTMYDWVGCHVVVLDGPVTDMIDEVPYELEDFQFSGSEITIELKSILNKKNPDGTPRMKIGVLNKVPSTRGAPKWVLQKSTDAHKDAARKWLTDHPVKADDPFA